MRNRQPSYADLIRLEPAIRGVLDEGARWLTFPAELESFFQRAQAEQRFARYKVIAWLALLIFNVFIPTDRLLLPDIYPLTLYVRLLVFTPLLLLTLLWLRHPSSVKIRDEIVMLMIWLAAASIILFLLLTHHPNVVHYHNGLILVMMFGIIVVRLPFWKGVVCSLGILLAYGLTLSHIQNMSFEVTTNAVAVILVATFISLAANYQMELDARRVYAHDLLQDLNALRLEQANADLENLSRLDGLTEIANRRTFDGAFDQAWRDALRHQTPVSVIMFDVDAFKAYNDTYGHLAGDRCLQQVARVLMGSLFRPHDLAARYGGEEFIILLPETRSDDAQHVAQRICAGVIELQIPHKGNPAAPYVTFSAGVATVIPAADMQPHYVLHAADEALYRAKQAGRNQIAIAPALV